MHLYNSLPHISHHQHRAQLQGKFAPVQLCTVSATDRIGSITQDPQFCSSEIGISSCREKLALLLTEQLLLWYSHKFWQIRIECSCSAHSMSTAPCTVSTCIVRLTEPTASMEGTHRHLPATAAAPPTCAVDHFSHSRAAAAACRVTAPLMYDLLHFQHNVRKVMENSKDSDIDCWT